MGLTINDENRTSSVRFSVLNTQDYLISSIEFGVQVNTKYLNGGFISIWIQKDAIETFIEGLHQLDQTRKGAVLLTSMSPDELTLEVKALDGWGHLGVGIRVEQHNPSQVSYKNILQTGFEIDPTSLPSIIAQLKRILTP